MTITTPNRRRRDLLDWIVPALLTASILLLAYLLRTVSSHTETLGRIEERQLSYNSLQAYDHQRIAEITEELSVMKAQQTVYFQTKRSK